MTEMEWEKLNIRFAEAQIALSIAFRALRKIAESNKTFECQDFANETLGRIKGLVSEDEE